MGYDSESEEGNVPPDVVIRAEYIFPALEERERKTMQENRLEQIIPTHGTPILLVRPIKRGALPFRDMNINVRDATYSEPFPAEMTLMTIRALIKCAAGRIPASVRAIVKGELAVLADEPRSLLSLYGMRIPMKNIVPM